MALAADYIIYADLNCPFCYALNEYFVCQVADATVDWRAIQHDLNASSEVRGFEILAELTEEVKSVRQRLPGVEIFSPGFRPHSGLASEMLVAAAALDPDKARCLRTAVYRALWVEGRDISRPEVLQTLAEGVGLPSLVVAKQDIDRLDVWQREWSDGEFNNEIPITLCADGRRLIGFPELPQIHAFFNGGATLEAGEDFATCAMKPRHAILLLSHDSIVQEISVRELTEHDIVVCADVESLQCKLREQPTDLILLDGETPGVDIPRLCAQMHAEAWAAQTPLVLLGQRDQLHEEVRAFEAGAADFIAKPLQPTIFRARCATQLRIKRSIALLESMARLDGLTGIYNRRELDRALETEWQRALRHTECLSVVLLDVDHFKNYNDFYGHARGDHCLKTVAQVLSGVSGRPTDMVARYGGEEFVLLLPGTGKAGALVVAEHCRRGIESIQIPHEAMGDGQYLTISVGVSSLQPTRDRAPDSVLQAADRGLYQAKAAGRNRVVYHPV